MILNKSVIYNYVDVNCLFNKEVHKYVISDMKCQMPVNNVLVNYGTQ